MCMAGFREVDTFHSGHIHRHLLSLYNFFWNSKKKSCHWTVSTGATPTAAHFTIIVGCSNVKQTCYETELPEATRKYHGRQAGQCMHLYNTAHRCGVWVYMHQMCMSATTTLCKSSLDAPHQLMLNTCLAGIAPPTPRVAAVLALTQRSRKINVYRKKNTITPHLHIYGSQFRNICRIMINTWTGNVLLSISIYTICIYNIYAYIMYTLHIAEFARRQNIQYWWCFT